MYLTLTRENEAVAQVNDDGWAMVECQGQKWDRIDSGVWVHQETGDKAVRTRRNMWRFRGRTHRCIKRLMLSKRFKKSSS